MSEKKFVDYHTIIANLQSDCEKVLSSLTSQKLFTSIENAERRRLYADAALLKIEIELGNIDVLQHNKDKLLEQLSEVQSKVNLKQVTPSSNIFSLVDSLIRITAVWQCLFTFSFTLLVPSLVLLPFEKIVFYMLGIRSQYHSSNIFKHFIANYILIVSGVNAKISYETNEKETFQDAAIVCYSHSSTIDAFLISYAISPKTYALVGKIKLYVYIFQLYYFGHFVLFVTYLLTYLLTYFEL